MVSVLENVLVHRSVFTSHPWGAQGGGTTVLGSPFNTLPHIQQVNDTLLC